MKVTLRMVHLGTLEQVCVYVCVRKEAARVGRKV